MLLAYGSHVPCKPLLELTVSYLSEMVDRVIRFSVASANSLLRFVSWVIYRAASQAEEDGLGFLEEVIHIVR